MRLRYKIRPKGDNLTFTKSTYYLLMMHVVMRVLKIWQSSMDALFIKFA